MIRDAGHPLTRGEIAERFALRDVALPGEDKPRYIGTIMWRNKAKFINIEGRGYWLRGELSSKISGVSLNTPYSDPPSMDDADSEADDALFK